MDNLDGLLVIAKKYLGDIDVLSARPWMCQKKHGHALGLLVEIAMDGCISENLLMFRNAVVTEFINSEARIMSRAEGTTHNIECSMCEAERTFWIGKNGVKRLVKAYVAE